MDDHPISAAPSTHEHQQAYLAENIEVPLAHTTLVRVVNGLRSLCHASQDGGRVTDTWLLLYIIILFILGAIVSVMVKSTEKKALTSLVASSGVRSVKRIARTVTEIERKTFHAAGLFVPLLYNLLLSNGWTATECALMCWVITIGGWVLDLSRLYIPAIRDNWPLQSILREKEKTQLTGGCYFSLGCTLAINLFSPATATASISFLVIGDMMAALIGVAFGGETCTVKLGREGNKSMEGSLAMFFSCFIVGVIVFGEEPLREYPIFLGAAAATLVELWEPFAINDNLTIPVIAGLAIHFGFARLHSFSELYIQDAKV